MDSLGWPNGRTQAEQLDITCRRGKEAILFKTENLTSTYLPIINRKLKLVMLPNWGQDLNYPVYLRWHLKSQGFLGNVVLTLSNALAVLL